MRLKQEFVVARPRRELIDELSKDETFASLFPKTRVVALGKGVRETRTPFTALGQSREIRFVFQSQPDGNILFHKICDGNIWRSLDGEVRLEAHEASSTSVALQMEGATRAFVPEFTIRGQMQEQIDQMAKALRASLDNS